MIYLCYYYDYIKYIFDLEKKLCNYFQLLYRNLNIYYLFLEYNISNITKLIIIYIIKYYFFILIIY